MFIYDIGWRICKRLISHWIDFYLAVEDGELTGGTDVIWQQWLCLNYPYNPTASVSAAPAKTAGAPSHTDQDVTCFQAPASSLSWVHSWRQSWTLAWRRVLATSERCSKGATSWCQRHTRSPRASFVSMRTHAGSGAFVSGWRTSARCRHGR